MKVLLAIATSLASVTAQAETVTVGSKNFAESAILAELMAQTIEAHTELRVQRRPNLGGTMICWGALTAGEIDLYAEYTGTAWATVLQEREPEREPLRVFLEVRRRCRERHDVAWLDPFGLDNTYALAMTRGRAERLGVRRISDLRPHQAGLRAGFGIEFGSRADGWPGLAAAYDLELGSVRTLEHGLGYEALRTGEIDLMDVYSTDGKLVRFDLVVLEDDRRFFPPYHAAPVVRGELLRRHPEVAESLQRLAFEVTDADAQALNLLVEDRGVTPAEAARRFLQRVGIVAGEGPVATAPEHRPGLLQLARGRAGRSLWQLLQHLGLTIAAVLLATLAAVPLGIAIVRRERLRQVTLAFAGIVQTIPSLALLAFMIPLLGLGVQAAISALLLYALLPIVRNTYTGLASVDADLVDAARGMGLRSLQILRHVQLPLAMPTIMAGIRTATVISIGVATLAAFVGAGGLGEPIVEGLYLNDANLILLGAVPAALLAVLADAMLGRVERALRPGSRPVDVAPASAGATHSKRA